MPLNLNGRLCTCMKKIFREAQIFFLRLGLQERMLQVLSFQRWWADPGTRYVPMCRRRPRQTIQHYKSQCFSKCLLIEDFYCVFLCVFFNEGGGNWKQEIKTVKFFFLGEIEFFWGPMIYRMLICTPTTGDMVISLSSLCTKVQGRKGEGGGGGRS